MQKEFASYINAKSMTFRHSKGASIESGKEIHTYHEVILLLEGNAQLITEGLNTVLCPNTLIVIPKETYHQVVIHGDESNYHRFVLNFEDIPNEKAVMDDALSGVAIIEADGDIEFLFNKLEQSIGKRHADLVLRSVLTLLLCEISKRNRISPASSSQNPTVIAIIQYINDNLSRKIKMEDIARHCNISVSSLSHLFKKEMNIPLHKFIIKKRLIAAHHKISQGEAATVAAIECGFNDYSGFYKQYLKSFGVAPSKKR